MVSDGISRVIYLSICMASLQRGPATLLALDGVEESLAQRDSQAGFFVTFPWGSFMRDSC